MKSDTTSGQSGNDNPSDAATRIATRSLRYLSTLRPPAENDTGAQRLAERSRERLAALTAPGTPPAAG